MKAKYLFYLWVTSVLLAVVMGSACKPSLQPTAPNGRDAVRERALVRINKEGVLRVGYGIWTPYTDVDVSEQDEHKRVKGFSADLIREIVARSDPQLRLEFVRFNWATMKAGLDERRFDLIIEPVFFTVPRAQALGFSDPYSWFGVGCAVVRKDENRFSQFGDLDREDITISLAEGWTSTDVARANLAKPRFKMVVLRENNFAQLEDVLFGRADVALQDAPTVWQFVKAHPDKVKALWLENPPSIVAGGFAARPEDTDLLAFLNASLEVLRADGTIDRLDKKWKTLGLFEAKAYRPGVGLAER